VIKSPIKPPGYHLAGSRQGPSVLPWILVLFITSLLFVLSSTHLPIPTYNMAWGEFSHRLPFEARPPLIVTPGRATFLLVAGAGMLVAWVFLAGRAARALGARFAAVPTAILLASGATLLPAPRHGGTTDLALLIYAVRVLALALMVISGGWFLGRIAPRFLRSWFWSPVQRMARSAWSLPSIALLLGLGILAVVFLRLDGIPHAADEIGQIFQAKIFASGRLWADLPPDPDLISPFGILIAGGRWRAMWLPGNALAMAPLVAANVPWLYPALIAAMTVIAVFALVARSDDRRTAWVALILLLTSPWFWSMGSSYMSHSLVALLLAGFLAFFIPARRGSAAASALAGGFLGLAAATRTADALLLALPFGVLWALDGIDPGRRHRWWARSAAMALGLVPGVGFLLWNNLAAHGGLFVFGYDIWFGGPYRFGLGPKAPGIQLDPLYTPVHTIVAGLSNAHHLLTQLQVVLFGIGIPSLVPLLFSACRGARDGIGLAGIAGLALFLGAYVFWPVGLSMYGPRYAYAALPLFILLGARGLVWIHRRLDGLGQAWALPGIIGFGLLVAALHSIPSALASFDASYAGVDRRLERELKAQGIERAVIAVVMDQRGLRGNSLLYNAAFRLADPHLKTIVPLRYLKGCRLDAALEAFPDRPAYFWLALYEGSFHQLHHLTSLLIRIRRPGEAGFVPKREAVIRRAVDAYQEAIYVGPGSVKFWNSLGILASLKGDSRLTRHYLARASQLDPRDPIPWLNLALLEHAEGRQAAAREAAEEALRRGASLPPVLAALLKSPSS
jgi:tetratricopeptide (TPR) repeat protein